MIGDNHGCLASTSRRWPRSPSLGRFTIRKASGIREHRGIFGGALGKTKGRRESCPEVTWLDDRQKEISSIDSIHYAAPSRSEQADVERERDYW